MLSLIFANPGVGKTTLACKIALHESIRSHYGRKGCYDYIFLNFEHTVPGVRICDTIELGKWTFPRNSLVILDEAGIEYNNRKYKSFPEYAIKWYKKHRHYGVDVILISQEVDIDITLMRLIADLSILYKMGPFTLSRAIYRKIVPDKEKHELKHGYFFAHVLQIFLPFLKTWKLTFRPLYYKYFDTYECDDLPVRDFAETEIPYIPVILKVKSFVVRLLDNRRARCKPRDDQKEKDA